MNISELENKTVGELSGVGPKSVKSYASLGIETIADLVKMMPRGYEDRSHRVCIGRQTGDGLLTNTIVTVLGKSKFGKGLKSVKAVVEDMETGVRAEILGFNRPFLDHVIYEGCIYHLYGNQMAQDGHRIAQFSQFELKPVREEELMRPDAVINGGMLAVYSLSGNLTQNIVRRDVANALRNITVIDEILPSNLIEKYRLIDYDSAIRKMHNPLCEEDIVNSRRTLAFSEVFYMQLASMRRPAGSDIRRSTEKRVYEQESRFIANLSFKLTGDQEKVLDEIRTDMSKSESMNRLLQGDVGSGKTMVAWISAVHVIAEGRQVAFMAPTELLARQHSQNAAKLFEKTGISVAYLDGEVHGKSRQLLLEQLAKGNINLLIGTHALFSKDVKFSNLGYVIIDEQHRFGVEQRNALFRKGENPDILLMTATPIPRTLALTVYGNLNVSTIKTMPAGRIPIKTFLVDSSRRQEMYRSVGVELSRGHQAYFVYPRIEADEEQQDSSGLRDVETMYGYLSTRQYPQFRGALIHSRLSDDEKIKILNDFSEKKLDYLVATSVVEVGLDVPEATCMVVEHAEVFGLSALHQLRGRVGRSSLASWCFLVYEKNISDDGKKRLSVLRRTNDGFEIAEEDLKIRGPGEITGLRQSGFTNLKYASMDRDIEMMACARDEVAAILKDDPGLLSVGNSVIRQNLFT
ncbi:MAG: ATP-dependent DNA helicase RecG [Sphaerochaetaceae bacterium]|nr:ATP-dependent DNA helicase RecG [Sphaerochaetaceae bacterium]